MWGPRTAIALGASSASQGSSLTPVGSPDFPVIGAMKSGTTSLCQQLIDPCPAALLPHIAVHAVGWTRRKYVRSNHRAS
jgi:hypothetical protein